MSENTKNRWQNRRRHDVHDCDMSGTFCGMVFMTIRTNALNFWMKNPTRCDKSSQAR